MTGVLTFFLMNIRSFLLSIGGFVFATIILERVSGFRYGRGISILITGIMVCARYFGLTLYVQIYLAGKYAGEDWFNRMLGLLTLLNVFVGIGWIALVFKGSLIKNLLLEFFLEFIIGLGAAIPIFLFSNQGEDKYQLANTWNPLDLLIYAVFFFIIYMVITKAMGTWFERYAVWEPQHPALLLAILCLAFLLGMYDNIRYALSGGSGDLFLFFIVFALLSSFVWVFFFHQERMKVLKTRHELIRYEATLKNHYQQIILQSAKVNLYNKEIQEAIEKLVERIEEEKGEGLFPEASDGGEDNGGEGRSEGSETGNTGRDLAESYLQDLTDHYRQISVSKYSDDIRMNDMLTGYETRFLERGIPFQFGFSHYVKPDYISQEDVEALLSLMLDEALEQIQALTLEPGSSGLVFRGGITGGNLIFSCRYPGELPTKRYRRELRRLCRRMKADMDISLEEAEHSATSEENDMTMPRGIVKVIIGMSSVLPHISYRRNGAQER